MFIAIKAQLEGSTFICHLSSSLYVVPRVFFFDFFITLVSVVSIRVAHWQVDAGVHHLFTHICLCSMCFFLCFDTVTVSFFPECTFACLMSVPFCFALHRSFFIPFFLSSFLIFFQQSSNFH